MSGLNSFVNAFLESQLVFPKEPFYDSNEERNARLDKLNKGLENDVDFLKFRFAINLKCVRDFSLEGLRELYGESITNQFSQLQANMSADDKLSFDNVIKLAIENGSITADESNDIYALLLKLDEATINQYLFKLNLSPTLQDASKNTLTYGEELALNLSKNQIEAFLYSLVEWIRGLESSDEGGTNVDLLKATIDKPLVDGALDIYSFEYGIQKNSINLRRVQKQIEEICFVLLNGKNQSYTVEKLINLHEALIACSPGIRGQILKFHASLIGADILQKVSSFARDSLDPILLTQQIETRPNYIIHMQRRNLQLAYRLGLKILNLDSWRDPNGVEIDKETLALCLQKNFIVDQFIKNVIFETTDNLISNTRLTCSLSEMGLARFRKNAVEYAAASEQFSDQVADDTGFNILGNALKSLNVTLDADSINALFRVPGVNLSFITLCNVLEDEIAENYDKPFMMRDVNDTSPLQKETFYVESEGNKLRIYFVDENSKQRDIMSIGGLSDFLLKTLKLAFKKDSTFADFYSILNPHKKSELSPVTINEQYLRYLTIKALGQERMLAIAKNSKHYRILSSKPQVDGSDQFKWSSIKVEGTDELHLTMLVIDGKYEMFLERGSAESARYTDLENLTEHEYKALSNFLSEIVAVTPDSAKRKLIATLAIEYKMEKFFNILAADLDNVDLFNVLNMYDDKKDKAYESTYFDSYRRIELDLTPDAQLNFVRRLLHNKIFRERLSFCSVDTESRGPNEISLKALFDRFGNNNRFIMDYLMTAPVAQQNRQFLLNVIDWVLKSNPNNTKEILDRIFSDKDIVNLYGMSKKEFVEIALNNELYKDNPYLGSYIINNSSESTIKGTPLEDAGVYYVEANKFDVFHLFADDAIDNVGILHFILLYAGATNILQALLYIKSKFPNFYAGLPNLAFDDLYIESIHKLIVMSAFQAASRDSGKENLLHLEIIKHLKIEDVEFPKIEGLPAWKFSNLREFFISQYLRQNPTLGSNIYHDVVMPSITSKSLIEAFKKQQNMKFYVSCLFEIMDQSFINLQTSMVDSPVTTVQILDYISDFQSVLGMFKLNDVNKGKMYLKLKQVVPLLKGNMQDFNISSLPKIVEYVPKLGNDILDLYIDDSLAEINTIQDPDVAVNKAFLIANEVQQLWSIARAGFIYDKILYAKIFEVLNAVLNRTDLTSDSFDKLCQKFIDLYAKNPDKYNAFLPSLVERLSVAATPGNESKYSGDVSQALSMLLPVLIPSNNRNTDLLITVLNLFAGSQILSLNPQYLRNNLGIRIDCERNDVFVMMYSDPRWRKMQEQVAEPAEYLQLLETRIKNGLDCKSILELIIKQATQGWNGYEFDKLPHELQHIAHLYAYIMGLLYKYPYSITPELSAFINKNIVIQANYARVDDFGATDQVEVKSVNNYLCDMLCRDIESQNVDHKIFHTIFNNLKSTPELLTQIFASVAICESRSLQLQLLQGYFYPLNNSIVVAISDSAKLSAMYAELFVEYLSEKAKNNFKYMSNLSIDHGRLSSLTLDEDVREKLYTSILKSSAFAKFLINTRSPIFADSGTFYSELLSDETKDLWASTVFSIFKDSITGTNRSELYTSNGLYPLDGDQNEKLIRYFLTSDDKNKAYFLVYLERMYLNLGSKSDESSQNALSFFEILEDMLTKERGLRQKYYELVSDTGWIADKLLRDKMSKSPSLKVKSTLAKDYLERMVIYKAESISIPNPLARKVNSSIIATMCGEFEDEYYQAVSADQIENVRSASPTRFKIPMRFSNTPQEYPINPRFAGYIKFLKDSNFKYSENIGVFLEEKPDMLFAVLQELSLAMSKKQTSETAMNAKTLFYSCIAQLYKEAIESYGSNTDGIPIQILNLARFFDFAEKAHPSAVIDEIRKLEIDQKLGLPDNFSFYTWQQKSKGVDGKGGKIDMIMGAIQTLNAKVKAEQDRMDLL